MARRQYRMLVTKGENGQLTARVLGHPQCQAEGQTYEELEANIRKALTDLLVAQGDHGDPDSDPPEAA